MSSPLPPGEDGRDSQRADAPGEGSNGEVLSSRALTRRLRASPPPEGEGFSLSRALQSEVELIPREGTEVYGFLE